MGRFANSWALIKASMRVVAQDKELLVLPILSFAASIVAFMAVVGIGFGAQIVPELQSADGQINLPAVVLLAATYLGLAFIQVFFGAAVVAGASERLAGGNPTLGSCLRAASRKAGRLFVWSIFVAVVNLLLTMLRQRGGQAGRLAAGMGNLAWALVTYFMLPILMFENDPVIKSLGRSGSLFKKTWGETVIGNGGVSVVFGLLMGVVVVGAVLLSDATGTPLAVFSVALVVLLLLFSLQAVLTGVYKAALYRYATTGQASGGFEASQLRGAFVPK